MEINCLIIDDENDKRAFDQLQEDLQYEVNKGASISYEVNLSYENPMKFIGDDFVYDKLFNYLDETYLNKKLDLFLCDFNIHPKHKHIAFHIIDHVRKKNKACTIILFSGSPLKELIRLNNNDLAQKISDHILEDNKHADVEMLIKQLEFLRKEEEPAEKLMEMAVKSNISAIVSRTKYEEKALELIKSPSMILWVENELHRNADLIFNDGDEKVNGMRLGEIAIHVREQTEVGKYFTVQIIQMAMANLVNFNS